MPQDFIAVLGEGGQRRCSSEQRIHLLIGCLRSRSKRPFTKYNLDVRISARSSSNFVLPSCLSSKLSPLKFLKSPMFLKRTPMQCASSLKFDKWNRTQAQFLVQSSLELALCFETEQTTFWGYRAFIMRCIASSSPRFLQPVAVAPSSDDVVFFILLSACP